MKYIVLFLLFPLSLLAQDSAFKKGKTLFDNKEYDKAQAVFKEYYQSHPEDLKTKEYLGDIASQNEDWDTAITYYKDLVENQEDNADFHYKYGGALGMKALEISRFKALTYIGDIKEEFKTAAALDSDHVDTRWALVKLYMQLPGILGGSKKTADEYARELLKISPVDGYLSKAFIEEESDNIKQAELYYKKAMEIGGSPHTYEQLADFYEKNNKPAAALKIAEESYEKHQQNPLNYRIGKIVAENNMQSALGIASLKRYIENHTEKDAISKNYAYLRLAQIYKNMGDKKQAMQFIDKALLDQPNFEEALSVRADIRNL